MENCHGSVVHIKILDWHLVNEYTANDDGQIPKKEDEGNYDKNAESRIELRNHPGKKTLVAG